VSGEASARQFRLLAAGAAVLAVAAAAPLGRPALLLVAVSLAIAHGYSLPPLRFSYRTYYAPLVLGVGYVLVPYLLGVRAAGSEPDAADALHAAALYARVGDARYGRPTLLLRFGKNVTCLVSAVALVLGAALLAAVVPLLLPVVVGLAAAIGWMLLSLWRAQEAKAEQVAIGIGARMGNGLLTCVLGWLVLSEAGASAVERLVFSLAIAGLFAASFVSLVRRPEAVAIGYKG
jgi:4-hydroxybenzoate polyprenyltransferase